MAVNSRFIIVAALAGCFARGTMEPPFRGASRVIMRGWEDADPKRPYVFTDRDSILALVAFIEHLNGPWQPARLDHEPAIRAEFRDNQQTIGIFALTGAPYDDGSPPNYFVRTMPGRESEMRLATRSEAWAFLKFFGIVGYQLQR